MLAVKGLITGNSQRNVTATTEKMPQRMKAQFA